MLYGSVKDRVHTGATLLDRVRPDWFRHVDKGLLAIKSCRWCVLGQVYGDFASGMVTLFGFNGGTTENAMSHGFDASNLPEITLIHRAWKEEVDARLNYGSRNAERSEDYVLAV